MAYKFKTANQPFFPTYVEPDREATLLRMLAEGHDLDFGDYDPKGGGTTLAHLRRTSPSEVRFEGVGTPDHSISVDVSPERILAHWTGFCGKVREIREASRTTRGAPAPEADACA